MVIRTALRNAPVDFQEGGFREKIHPHHEGEKKNCSHQGAKKKKTNLEFCGSRLTRSLYSENIQRGPLLGEYANEVLNMSINNNGTHG